MSDKIDEAIAGWTTIRLSPPSPFIPSKLLEQERELERERKRIHLDALIMARNLVCGYCRDGKGPHGCRAYPIRAFIASIDATMSDLTVKDWLPGHKPSKKD